jgi:hypothetical protein
MRRQENFPSVDDSFVGVQRAGWTVGDAAVYTDKEVVWMVSGTNCENGIQARGNSQRRLGGGQSSRPRLWEWPGAKTMVRKGAA